MKIKIKNITVKCRWWQSFNDCHKLWESCACEVLEFVKAVPSVRYIVTKSWTVKQLSKFLTGRCGLIWNPLDIRFSSAGNEWKKCFHWTVNLLVPARNLRFNWTWSCSETRKRERSREREGGAEGMSHSGQLWRFFCSQHQWHTLSLQLRRDNMASPRHFGRTSVDIANVMQKLQGKCHSLAQLAYGQNILSSCAAAP